MVSNVTFKEHDQENARMETGTVFDLYFQPGPGAKQAQPHEEKKELKPERLKSLAETTEELKRVIVDNVKRKLTELFQSIGIDREVTDQEAEAIAFAGDSKYLQYIDSLTNMIRKLNELEQALQNVSEPAKAEITTAILRALSSKEPRKRRASGDGAAAEIAEAIKEIIKTREIAKELIRTLRELEKLEKDVDETETTLSKSNGSSTEIMALRSELAQIRRLLQQALMRRQEDELSEIEEVLKRLERVKDRIKKIAPILGLKIKEGNEPDIVELAKANPQIAKIYFEKMARANIMNQSLLYNFLNILLSKFDKLLDIGLEKVMEVIGTTLSAEPTLGGEETSEEDEFRRLVEEELKKYRRGNA